MKTPFCRRDLFVAFSAVCLTAVVVTAVQQPAPAILRSTAFDWDAMSVRTTNVGSSRQIMRQPTATLDELEMHVTTLNAGQTSHAPHQHVNEEVMVIREGTVEVLVRGTWTRLGPGSVAFNASNELHAIRNAGATPATYHVINWMPPGMKAKTTAP